MALKLPRSLPLGASIGLLLGLVAFLVVGCDLPGSEPTAAPAPPGATTTTTAGIAELEASVEPQEEVLETPDVLTLTVWTTELFSPTDAITTGQILAERVAALEADHPDIRVEFLIKQSYGDAGLLDYLLTAAPVVPDLLPDIVFIDVDELAVAVQSELVQPLDDLIAPELTRGLYAFARASCSFDGRLYGLQFLADLDHLVYDSGQISIRPSSWAGVLSSPAPYLFPAGGKAGLVNDAFLIQYLAVRGGGGKPEMDGPFLERDALVGVLQFYQDGVSRGIFPLQIVGYHTTDDGWRDYLAGEGAMVLVSARRYLAERENSPGSVPVPIPAINGPAPAIGRGWALALVTADPRRQSLAVELMTGLMEPETNAAWNRAAGYLPVRQTGLAFWDTADPYTPFIQQELLKAIPRPRFDDYSQTLSEIQTAVEDVINGEATPEEAADRVMGLTE